MKKAILILFFLTCACQQPFDFKNEYWLLERVDLDVDRQLGIIKVNGDTMRYLLNPPYIGEYIGSVMDLTTDSMTIPSVCVENRVKYIVDEQVLFLGSTYKLSPIKVEDINSQIFFDETYLKIDLQPFQELEDKIDKQKDNYGIYIGKYLSFVEKDTAFQNSFAAYTPFFKDGYHLKVNDIFLDSVEIKLLFKELNSSKGSSCVSLYIDKGFDSQRKKQFIEYLIKKTHKELEIYEGCFSIGQYPFVKHKKYSHRSP